MIPRNRTRSQRRLGKPQTPTQPPSQTPPQTLTMSMTMNFQTHNSGRSTVAGLLWVSAFVLAALVIVQSGRMVGGGNLAKADVVSRVGDYTTLTMSANTSEDLALVLDGRAEKLFVYRIKNREALELVKPYDLQVLFSNGAKVGAGKVK